MNKIALLFVFLCLAALGGCVPPNEEANAPAAASQAGAAIIGEAHESAAPDLRSIPIARRS